MQSLKEFFHDTYHFNNSCKNEVNHQYYSDTLIVKKLNNQLSNRFDRWVSEID